MPRGELFLAKHRGGCLSSIPLWFPPTAFCPISTHNEPNFHRNLISPGIYDSAFFTQFIHRKPNQTAPDLPKNSPTRGSHTSDEYSARGTILRRAFFLPELRTQSPTGEWITGPLLDLTLINLCIISPLFTRVNRCIFIRISIEHLRRPVVEELEEKKWSTRHGSRLH